MTPDEQRNFGAITHIVHDWSMLLQAGAMTGVYHPHPLNHFIQHAFLVECRKFGDFFENNRGPKGNDAISKDFVSSWRSKPKLSAWTTWRDNMNQQFMHLSFSRVTNKVS